MFKNEIIASIDAGKPMIVKVKTGSARFRVITGYDGDALICPDFTNAQQKPEHAHAYGEIEVVKYSKTGKAITILRVKIKSSGEKEVV